MISTFRALSSPVVDMVKGRCGYLGAMDLVAQSHDRFVTHGNLGRNMEFRTGTTGLQCRDKRATTLLFCVISVD